MIEPMMEFWNGSDRHMMFVLSQQFSSLPSYTILKPGESITVFDQRSMVTAMIRDLTEKELEDFLEKEKELMERNSDK